MQNRGRPSESFMRRFVLALAAATAVAAPASSALAWGASGHRVIGELGAQALPSEIPAFLRKKEVAVAVGEYARELDRSKGAGRIHDNDRDPAHFADIDDNGRMLGGPLVTALPATRNDYETALRAAGTNSWQAGYLPYAMVDGWQQLVKDFNIWRVLVAAEKVTKNPARKRYYRLDRARREALIVRDIGIWAHYVGDASQPLHATDHYNGWGKGPNPQAFTTEGVHGPFEGGLTRPVAGNPAAIRALMPAAKPCGCTDIMPRVEGYLLDTNRQVVPLYQMWKDKALMPGSPAGETFIAQRLAVGSAELRDMVVDAWRASATMRFGYRPDMSLEDIASGKADPWGDLYGKD
jgi:hypothetical protein